MNEGTSPLVDPLTGCPIDPLEEALVCAMVAADGLALARTRTGDERMWTLRYVANCMIRAQQFMEWA